MCFKRRHSVPIVLLTSPRGPSVSETWYSPGHHIVTHISSSLFYIGSFLCVQAYLFVIYKKIICNKNELPSSPREIATSYLKFYMKGSYLPPRENFKLPYLPNQAH